MSASASRPVIQVILGDRRLKRRKCSHRNPLERRISLLRRRIKIHIGERPAPYSKDIRKILGAP
jgi:hypothetical protein